MNFLFVVPSFYDIRLPKKVKTGQAIIASELCSNFSEKVDVFVTGYPVRSADLGYANIISTGLCSLIPYIKAKDIVHAVRNIAENPSAGLLKRLKNGAKTLFYKAMARKVVHYAEQNNCDVVAIHDFGQGNLEVLKKCIEDKLKCVVTLHLYVGKNTTMVERMYFDHAEREEYLLTNTDVPITVVSSGIKRRILKDYKNVSPERITVISNGTKIDQFEFAEVAYEKKKRKFFLCIGTISHRKNQIQLLQALRYLPQNVRDQIKVLFIGVDTIEGKLQDEICNGNYQDVAEYIGPVEHEKISSYFLKAFAVISTSLNEAFGLTFIEGFAYGIPAIFFDDIDAAKELYSYEAVELIHGKRCQDIASAIANACHNAWDKKKIRKHAENFDIQEKAKEYEEMYRMIGKRNM